MAETVVGLQIKVSIVGSIVGDDGKMQAVNIQKSYHFEDGTAANQVGQWFYDESRTLATTSEDLDLAGSSLVDFQGAAMALNNIKVLFVEGLDTDTGDGFLLKQGSSAPVTTMLGGTSPTLGVGAGGFVLIVNPTDGYAVTATTADKLAIESLDSSSYKILIAGDNA